VFTLLLPRILCEDKLVGGVQRYVWVRVTVLTLLLLRILCEDKLVGGVQRYVWVRVMVCGCSGKVHESTGMCHTAHSCNALYALGLSVCFFLDM
jgi:hypothetical protein